MDTCIFIAESLHYSPEAITTLSVNGEKKNVNEHCMGKRLNLVHYLKQTKQKKSSHQLGICFVPGTLDAFTEQPQQKQWHHLLLCE